MQSAQTGSRNGRESVRTGAVRNPSDTHELPATCRRQAAVIRMLGEAVGEFRQGVRALKAENADLRVENSRLHRELSHGLQSRGPAEASEPLEILFPLDARAPGAARTAVEVYLGGRVAPSALDDAQLLVSELVTNSVCHSGVPAGGTLVLRLQLGWGWCHMEVEDPGHEGAVAPHPADLLNGSGMGLNLVQMLSDRWGVERANERGTRVWAHLRCARVPSGPTPTAARTGDLSPC
jgi:anti-sigma regulatory factor (Ser/Thr protein kinase)